MPPCGCSLRSTQCAALIALAAVAGISRLDRPLSEQSATLETGEMTTPDATVCSQVSVFYHFCRAAAPWFRFFAPSFTPGDSYGDTMSTADESGGGQPVRALNRLLLKTGQPPGGLRPLIHFETALLVPSARGHSFPYAVGPPRHGSIGDERGAGLCGPGDSEARSRFVRWIASTPDFSRNARATSAGPTIRIPGHPFRAMPCAAGRNTLPSSSRVPCTARLRPPAGGSGHSFTRTQ